MVNTNYCTIVPKGTSFEDFVNKAYSQNIDPSWTMGSTMNGEVYTIVNNTQKDLPKIYFIDGEGRVKEKAFHAWYFLHNTDFSVVL